MVSFVFVDRVGRVGRASCGRKKSRPLNPVLYVPTYRLTWPCADLSFFQLLCIPSLVRKATADWGVARDLCSDRPFLRGGGGDTEQRLQRLLYYSTYLCRVKYLPDATHAGQGLVGMVFAFVDLFPVECFGGVLWWVGWWMSQVWKAGESV